MWWVYAVLCARHRPHWPRPAVDCRSILSYNNSKNSIHPRRSYLPSSRTARLWCRVDFFPSVLKETAVSPEGTGFSGGSRGPLPDDSRFESIRRRSPKGKWMFVNFYTSGLLVDRCRTCGCAGNSVGSGSRWNGLKNGDVRKLAAMLARYSVAVTEAQETVTLFIASMKTNTVNVFRGQVPVRRFQIAAEIACLPFTRSSATPPRHHGHFPTSPTRLVVPEAAR